MDLTAQYTHHFPGQVELGNGTLAKLGEIIKAAGERIWNLERLFNIRAGLTAEDDSLPARQTTPEGAIPDGPTKGQYNRLKKMLPEYYQERSWDAQGKPSAEQIAALEHKSVPSRFSG